MDIEIPFIGNERLRKSLNRDIGEAEAAMAAHNWKSAIVLYGCILEAVILDALLTRNVKTNSKGKAVESLELGPLIETAEAHNLISSETAMSSNAIRNYRNLIHPGREFRLEISPSEGIADIARGLLILVINSITKKWADKKRRTSTEVMEFINKNPNDKLMIVKLISDMWELDRMDLLNDKLIRAFIAKQNDIAQNDPDVTVFAVSGLKTSFHQGFLMLEAENKSEVLKTICNLIRDGNKHFISWGFILQEYLAMADADDASLMSTGLVANWIRNPDPRQWNEIALSLKYVSEECVETIYDLAIEEINRNKNYCNPLISVYKLNDKYRQQIREDS